MLTVAVPAAAKVPNYRKQQCKSQTQRLNVAAAVSAPSAPVEARKPAATGGVCDVLLLSTYTLTVYCVQSWQILPSPLVVSVEPCLHMQVKHAMTLTEKILAKHSDNTRLQPGANIWTNVDKLLTHDVCGPGTFGIFEKEFGEGAQVWDPEKVIIIPDHYIFTSDPRANRNVDILRCCTLCCPREAES